MNAMEEWADAIPNDRPRVRSVEPDWSRRRLALVAIVIVLLAPFYCFFVWKFLTKLELRALEREMNQALQVQQDQAGKAKVVAAAMSLQEREAAAALDLRTRIAAVRVVGAIEGQPATVIVEHLPFEDVAEAAATICDQTRIWLRRETRGSTLRVQRDRGQEPALDAGVVVCP